MSKDSESAALAKLREVEAALMARIPEHKLRPRLEPTRRAVELLGDPQKSYRVIHITGTNGKTTTARIIERILREHGLRTGRFTSPHLINLNERIALDGEPVDNEIIYEIFKDIEPALDMVDAELLAAGDSRLTFFEALAVLGFAVFADAPIDVLVLEVGMGGEWDSTNVADGDVAVFTPIDIDHVERLGHTIAEIATTKSGIIKPGSIVVSAPQQPDALAVLETKAGAIADELKLAGRDFELLSQSESKTGLTFSVRGLTREYDDLFMPLHGKYQAHNAAVAIAAVEAFIGGGQVPIADDILRPALADVTSPGRLQVIAQNPRVILDAAHNPHGARSLGEALVTSFGAPHAVAVLSVLNDKDARELLSALDESIHDFVITQSSSVRALPAAELGELATEIFGADRVTVAEDFRDALAIAQGKLPAGENTAVVVSGSITLVGDVLAFVQEQEGDLDGEE